MADQDIAATVEALVQARRSGTQVEGLPAVPASVAEAHRIQDGVAAALGEATGAFKANAPPGEPPVRGLIPARMIRPSPARMPPAEVPHCGVEGEVAFRFTRDLPPREQPYGREEVAAAATVLPAIEVVSGRLRDPRTRPALEQLADCIANGGLVPGAELAEWSWLDLPRLRVTLLVNGAPVLEQEGGHPINDPLGVAVALVNLMREAGGVRAGQIVTTGSWTGLRFLQPGDRCTVRFEALGEAEVVFAG
ncbi:fumarylacetoacetate hydrolase family protein [Belnapia sp. T6]|uniref:Fumarylacetoacetate hydrolase family protein n=1 Tax=Belnapia mucosa TaxID=2804532 RepID=A0ABS1V421_9PROT|nr:fumarylacetoacetate hydrolase family protein [Belnapia mucosa]MBL6456429.1 fumarylacetoacetate hydrolase family protein [Belnapia mucosa]